MCGICGVVGVESKEAGQAAVRRMMDAMAHRGPDGEGTLFVPSVAVGMRRLSIIDLPGGSQPVWNETQTLATIFNGEIYNFRELRKDLENAGHRFRTRSDTEVIVHAYEEWGERCVRRLRGMFAFAVVEMPQGPTARATHVFLARDRLGIKPLYYTLADRKVFFASEVRALLASGAVPAHLAPEAIPAYLLFGSVCEPSTLVEGVASLSPGHSLRIVLGDVARSMDPIQYWWDAASANKTIAAARGSSESVSSTQQVRALLKDAVTSHLVADVPVGVFLSGGIDSTAIAALASESQGGIHTFTVAFPDAEFSEAEQARRTAGLLGTEHRELMLSDHDMLARFDDALAAFDQPSMDGINTFFVSWAARQAGLKVALSGLGSDEVFGGYTSFRARSAVAQTSMAGRLLPGSLRRLGGRMAGFAGAMLVSPDRLRKALTAFQHPDLFPDSYFFTRLLFTPGTLAQQPRSSASWKTLPWWCWLSDATRQSKAMDSFTRVSWLELRSYLLNTLLRDTDTASMGNSLEVRVPFLDAPLVEYVLSLPESLKAPSRQPKRLLIAALEGIVPRQVLSQRKRTFTFPWENWLRGSLRKRVAAGLADWSPALEPELGASFAGGVWRDFLNGRTTWSRPWSLYVLNEWVKRNLRSDRTGSSGLREPAAVA